MNTKRYLGGRMHEAGVGGKNFTSGIAELFDEVGFGACIYKTLTWPLAYRLAWIRSYDDFSMAT